MFQQTEWIISVSFNRDQSEILNHQTLVKKCNMPDKITKTKYNA